ncbi:MAG: DNA cytosine methyltransferase [Archaeoglobaceae archaeon]
MSSRYGFYEFFAGGGMARLGLGAQWQCLFANDFSPKKAESYRRNFPPATEFVQADVFDLSIEDLPLGAQLAWASFPCQDLSLAGPGTGLNGARSGSFWGFWRLMQELVDKGSPVPLIVLENVVGTITANKGQDFIVLLNALIDAGYVVGPMIIDAQYFVPQSRPRLFIVAIHHSVELLHLLVQACPDPRWHPQSIVKAFKRMSARIKEHWVWWNMPYPPPRKLSLIDVIEEEPIGVRWHSPEETNRLLELMSPVHLERVKAAQRSGRRVVGTIYRRIRITGGEKRQRAEIRIDDLSGCLRTGSGGSSKQFLMIIEGEKIRSRLLSPRETARLMGVDDSYILPERYNDAYHLMGDGLVVPVVTWLSQTILIPALAHEYVNERLYSVKRDELQLRLLERESSSQAYNINGVVSHAD